jgi:cytochrome c oxidase subunit IV
MTDTTAADTALEEHAEAEHGHDDHASDTLYIQVALGLAVLTGMEVAWPYIVDDGPILMWPLLIVMAIKFVIIAAFFMHLKFDSKVLTRVFYSGLFLAVGVYVIALTTFRIFES